MLSFFLTIAVVQIVALMSPGPDFFFVSQTAASRSRQQAFKGALGITLGVTLWATVALLGLNALLEKMQWLHQGIMVFGGLYLMWLGFQLLKSARSHHQQPAMPTAEVPVIKAYKNNTFLKGFLTSLSNPKAVIYFGSVFAVFVGNDMSSGQRLAILGLIIAETFVWFTLVATLFSLPWVREKYRRMAKWVDGVAGALFTVFGLHLIISR